jgi:hypothetical protein
MPARWPHARLLPRHDSHPTKRHRPHQLDVVRPRLRCGDADGLRVAGAYRTKLVRRGAGPALKLAYIEASPMPPKVMKVTGTPAWATNLYSTSPPVGAPCAVRLTLLNSSVALRQACACGSHGGCRAVASAVLASRMPTPIGWVAGIDIGGRRAPSSALRAPSPRSAGRRNHAGRGITPA